ncbi:MAG TPA: hypothetical protein VH331_17815 [Allosphingosinicella sp.]|jgi:hypothetical protein|nr:hypothetical protein [Allosphingosinicella sp.]
MERMRKLRAGTVAMPAAGLAALLLHAAFLAQDFAPHEGPGDDIGPALLAFATLLALWALLLVLLVIDEMRPGPAWRRAAILLVPVAGIATSFATDVSGSALCTLSLVTLPLVVLAYLLIGGLPGLRARPAADGARAVMLLLMAALSVYPVETFVS